MTFLRVVGKRLFWAAVLLVLVLCLNFSSSGWLPAIRR